MYVCIGVCNMFIIICIVGTFAQLFTKFARMYEVLINLRKIVYLFFPIHITACTYACKNICGSKGVHIFTISLYNSMSSLEFLIQIHGILFEFRAEIRLELRDSFGNTCPSDCTIKLPE